MAVLYVLSRLLSPLGRGEIVWLPLSLTLSPVGRGDRTERAAQSSPLSLEGEGQGEGEATRSIARANSHSSSATAASIRRMNAVRARRAARAAPVW
jgi:hypothetical protein